jgi:hypothetical protein
VKPRVTKERDPETGQLIERIHVPGPRVQKRVIAKAGEHPEAKEQVEYIETYPAEDVRDWGESLGHEGERGKIDGAVSGTFPRKSRLSAAMEEADLDADALAAKAMLPAELIRNLIDSGEVPGDDQRRQLEAIVPDPFPEYGELIEPTPNELTGDAIPTPRERRRGEPAQTRDEAEARSRRRSQLAAEVRSEADRRRAKAERREAALKATDLDGIGAKLRRLQDRLRT